VKWKGALTLAGHPFWKARDPQKRNRQRIEFFKDVALVGRLLLAVAGRE
jgi:putative oxidoreductase